MQTPVVSFLNYKGGVGKTNVAVNFSAYCSHHCNLKTLLIDWDPQGDATESIGYGRSNVRNTMFDILQNPEIIQSRDSILTTQIPNLDLIGSNVNLKHVENILYTKDNVYEIFSSIIQELRLKYDIIIIDCPPANSSVNVASMFASTDIFIVSTPTSDSVDKIPIVESTINQISDIIKTNSKDIISLSYPKLSGIILTMITPNTIGLKAAEKHLTDTWGNMLLSPSIARVMSVTYSVSQRIPIIISSPNEKISIEYKTLFKGILARVRINKEQIN